MLWIIAAAAALLIILLWQPIRDGWRDGWNGTDNRAKYRPPWIVEEEEDEPDDYNERATLEEEAAHLEHIIEKRERVAYELEKEANEARTSEKRRQAIDLKLITIDRADYRDRQRLKKIKEKLQTL